MENSEFVGAFHIFLNKHVVRKKAQNLQIGYEIGGLRSMSLFISHKMRRLFSVLHYVYINNLKGVQEQMGL